MLLTQGSIFDGMYKQRIGKTSLKTGVKNYCVHICAFKNKHKVIFSCRCLQANDKNWQQHSEVLC
jgi:hypothetical protein